MKNPIHPPSRVILDPTSGIGARYSVNSKEMVNPSCQSIESQSSHIPSIFNGTDFLNWKSEMKSYLKSIDMKCWNSIKNGYDIVSRVDIEFNLRATHILYSYIDDVQCSLISHCLTTQKIWPTLNALHGETDNCSKPQKSTQLQICA